MARWAGEVRDYSREAINRETSIRGNTVFSQYYPCNEALGTSSREASELASFW